MFKGRRFHRSVIVTGRCHVDETYLKHRGQWMCIYRAIDGERNASSTERWPIIAEPIASSSMAV
ncbi:DDE-type integrase/transposase/recombinase [Mesorhizobium loti]|uniref:DDE-type integrase/transposase/recombinase n=1 Tax=Rhizobium loti TaxID=381 RepID=UPI000B229410